MEFVEEIIKKADVHFPCRYLDCLTVTRGIDWVDTCKVYACPACTRIHRPYKNSIHLTKNNTIIVHKTKNGVGVVPFIYDGTFICDDNELVKQFKNINLMMDEELNRMDPTMRTTYAQFMASRMYE